MIKLIKNEFYKTFHQKGVYIFLGVIFGFIILLNFMNSRIYEVDNKKYIKNEISYLKEEISNYKKNNIIDINYLAELHFDLFAYELKYENNDTWVDSYIRNDNNKVIKDYYINYLNPNKIVTDEEFNLLKEQILKIKENVKSNNWKGYLQKKIDETNNELSILKQDRELNKKEISILEYDLNLLNYRMENGGLYEDGNYLNQAINLASDANNCVVNIDKNNVDAEEQFDACNKDLLTNEYIIKTQENINDRESYNYQITGLLLGMGQLIILFSLMISSGILSSEFKEGTIKSLLVTPYSRTKILISKYITSALMIVFIVLVLLIMQIVVGAIFFDVSEIGNSVINYNVATNSLVIENVFYNFFKVFIVFYPTLLFLSFISVSLSVLVPSTALCLAVPFIGYIFSEIVNYGIVAKKIEALKYFITLHWDFTTYLYGGQNLYSSLSLTDSIIVYLVFFIVIGIIAIYVFKRKNITNN